MNAPSQVTLQVNTDLTPAESPEADAREFHSISLEAATNLTLEVHRSLEDGEVEGTYFEGDIFAVTLEARSGPVATRIGFYPEAMFAFEHALKGALNVLFAPGADAYVDAVLKRQPGAVSAAVFNDHVDLGMDNATVSVTAGEGYMSWYGGRKSRADELQSSADDPSGPPVHGRIEMKAPAARELFRAVRLLTYSVTSPRPPRSRRWKPTGASIRPGTSLSCSELETRPPEPRGRSPRPKDRPARGQDPRAPHLTAVPLVES